MAWGLVIARPDGDLSADAWRAYAEQAGDFRSEDQLSSTNPRTGDVMTIDGPFEVWTGHPDGVDRVFRHSGAVVSVARPDEPTAARMREAAGALGAQLLTEDGEPY